MPEASAAVEILQRQNQDAKGYLRQEYGLQLRTHNGSSGAEGGHIQVSMLPPWRPAAKATKTNVITDVQQAMQHLVDARGLTIEYQRDSPGIRWTERGRTNGFSIRYRYRETEGLIQAAAAQNGPQAGMFLEERRRRNILSLGRRYTDPFLKD